MAHHQHYRSPFGDTTLTKVFVGGLAWETPTDVMRGYFDQFGDILEAVIITDKNSGKSKGYGFVTFRDPESARRACADPNPMIDGRRANCNIASLGRPRPSPPRGRNQVANVYQGSGMAQGGMSSYLPLPPPPPPVAPHPPVMYPPYGYTSYSPDYAYQQQIVPKQTGSNAGSRNNVQSTYAAITILQSAIWGFVLCVGLTLLLWVRTQGSVFRASGAAYAGSVLSLLSYADGGHLFNLSSYPSPSPFTTTNKTLASFSFG
ncbi:hypothetical protein SASPL_137096 [Salvia splendens]|uniref:RRM domain-containing protein n=1 Tax=Salvia splendens TaxID=180675 RepID=A0A8X8ZCW1_SALSN|nr:hypothetical protein SASPL_137096 [Salvia splendens]